MPKKIVLFDFDGTLSQGYISMAFLEWLSKSKIYPTELYQQQLKLVEANKQNKISYAEWCRQWGILWAEGLVNKTTTRIRESAQEFFEEYKTNIYSSSYQLVELFQKKEYYTFMITTAAQEVSYLAGKELGMDKTYGTEVLVNNDRYTNQLITKFHLPIGKKEFIEKIIKSGKYEMNTSVAFGDSMHDAAMLEKVKFPIALNPTKELFSLAQKNNWLILNYDNVIRQINKLF